ncbi:MAG: hypothetical protein ACYCVB_02545 [Bacilli bacterium]
MKRAKNVARIGGALVLTAIVALPVLQSGAFAATAKHKAHPKPAPAIVQSVIHSPQFAAFLHVKPQVVNVDLRHHKTLLDLALAAKITRPRLLSELEALVRDRAAMEIRDKHLTTAKAAALEKTVDASMSVWMADPYLGHHRGAALSGGLLKEVAKLTRLSAKEVKSKLRGGESVVKMAAAAHVSEAVLVKDLVAYRTAHEKHKVSAQILQKEVVHLINKR